MIEVLSALLNTTWWATIVAFALALATFLRPNGSECPGGLTNRLRGLLNARAFAALVGLGALFNATFALYRGYVVPRDIMQDIVSAREYLAGRSLYPTPMTKQIRQALETEPAGITLFGGMPRFLKDEGDALQLVFRSDWVQAHPPLMTLAMASLVRFFSIHATFLIVSAISLAALLLTLILVRQRLAPGLSWWESTVLFLAALGWEPITEVLRSGQVGIILGALMVIGWYCLAQRRPVWAGVALGLATCLKVYPGLLVFYLLLRHRKAFLAAVATIVAFLTFSVALCGWTTYREYFRTAYRVVSMYGDFADNSSWYGVLMRTVGGPEGRFATLAQVASAAVIIGTLIGLTWLVRTRHRSEIAPSLAGLNQEYALFMVLMLVMVAVSWTHYWASLILPLTVLGKWALRKDSRGSVLGFLALLVVLSVPVDLYYWLGWPLRDHVRWLVINWGILSIPVYAVTLFAFWLTVRVLRQDPSPGRSP